MEQEVLEMNDQEVRGKLEGYIEILDTIMDSVCDMRVPGHDKIYEKLDGAAELMAKARADMGEKRCWSIISNPITRGR